MADGVCADEGDGVRHAQTHLRDEHLLDGRATQLRLRQAVYCNGAGNGISAAELELDGYGTPGSCK